MAKIKKIKEGTATVYPATIPQAVIDPTSGKSVRTELNEKEAVANKKQTVTNSATDYPSGAAVTASLALKTDIAELNKIYPLYNYNVRVGTDSGSIGNIEELAKLYNENLALLGSTVFLWSGASGMKTRASGSNVFASKLYNMAATNDATQTTEASQPYVCGVIAPNEARKLKGRASNLIAFPAQTFTASTPFSITVVCKHLQNVLTSFTDNNYTIFDTQLSNGRIRFTFNSGSATVTNTNLLNYSSIGKNIIVTVVYSSNANWAFYLNGQYFGGTTATITTNAVVRDIRLDAGNELLHVQIHNRALSASEIQAQHDYLRLQIPEIEGIAIGNQYWATSNYEGVVAGDGSVIPEVQAAANVNTITNGDFVSSDISAWTNRTRCTMTWNVGEYVEVVSTGTGDFAIGRSATLTDYQNKWHKITFRAKSPNSTDVPKLLQTTHYTNILWVKRPALSTSWQEYEVLAYASNVANTIFYPVSSGAIIGTQVDIDDIVDQTVGWSQSTALYDAVYAQTSGTAAQKELAALKAAAMWCYYNNDVNNGAIYGKLYNWYAVKLISLYPPTGWRVPSSADFTQLQTYLGGSTVAGGKMKALYDGFNNSFATNESGFSSIGAGYRDTNPVTFIALNDTTLYSISDGAGASTTGYFRNIKSSSASLLLLSSAKDRGYSLRLLRNSPVGPNERTITSTTIVSDIASTANSTQIPFGYSVASIRLKTTANLTNIKVELWNNFYSGTPTLVATLITGKTANNTTMVFPVLADCPSLLQDGNLRVTATGASGAETVVEYNLQKNTF